MYLFMDITAEQSKRARLGNFVLTAFAATMFLGLAFGPLLMVALSLTQQNPIAAVLGLSTLP